MHNLTGEWNVVITSMMGEEKSIWKLSAEDGAITGNIYDMASGEEVGVIEETVSLGDNDFSFKTVLRLPFGKMPFTMTGTIDGDTATGISAMPMGESKFVATRK